jgi:hypothetical protein
VDGGVGTGTSGCAIGDGPGGQGVHADPGGGGGGGGGGAGAGSSSIAGSASSNRVTQYSVTGAARSGDTDTALGDTGVGCSLHDAMRNAPSDSAIKTPITRGDVRDIFNSCERRFDTRPFRGFPTQKVNHDLIRPELAGFGEITPIAADRAWYLWREEERETEKNCPSAVPTPVQSKRPDAI